MTAPIVLHKGRTQYTVRFIADDPTVIDTIDAFTSNGRQVRLTSAHHEAQTIIRHTDALLAGGTVPGFRRTTVALLLPAPDALSKLFAKLDEYLRLQQVETDSFILQCRRDDLRAALTAAQGT